MLNRHPLLLLPFILAACSNAAGPAATQPTPTPPASAAAASAHSSSAQPAPGQAPAAQAKRTYTLELPKRWTRQSHDGFETITGPEGVIKLHIWETSGDSLDSVVSGGWKKMAPTITLKERDRSTPTANERFSERLVVTYTDDTNEQMAQAIAGRHVKDKSRVYLLLLHGPLKTVQRRGSELGGLISSIEIEGAAKLQLKAANRKPFDEAKRKTFFAFVDAARQMAGVPGSAVAVVTPEGVFTKGFGTRVVGKPAPVNADTQLMIGSVTKSFSSLLLATLVDDGKVAWNTPVKKVYPSFKLSDARGDKVEIQHLFCACVGAPRRDMELLFEFAQKKPADVFNEIAKLKLTTEFGETFQYNNQLVAAGGFVAGHLAMGGGAVGTAYEKALRKRVLAPTGMKDSMLAEQKVRARNNFAMPHRLTWADETVAIDLALERFVHPYAPSGALWTTANDMAKYLQLQLAAGKSAAGKQVVSKRNLRYTQTKFNPEHGYGLGWGVSQHRGLQAIGHSGGTMGFSANVEFFPEIGVGLFIVSNRSPSVINSAVSARLFELLFDLPARAKDKLGHKLKEMKSSMAKSAAKVSADPVSPKLLGNYTNPTLGAVTLRRRGSAIEFDVGEWRANLAAVDPKDRKDALILTDGPLQGFIFFHRETAGKPELVIKYSESDYVLRKK